MNSSFSSSTWPLRIDFRIFNYFVRGYSVEECADALSEQYKKDSPSMFLQNDKNNNQIFLHRREGSNTVDQSEQQQVSSLISHLTDDYSKYLIANEKLNAANNKNSSGDNSPNRNSRISSSNKKSNNSRKHGNNTKSSKPNIASALLGSILFEEEQEQTNNSPSSSSTPSASMMMSINPTITSASTPSSSMAKSFLMEEILDHYTIFRQLEERAEFIHDPQSFLTANVDAISKTDRNRILEDFYALDPLFFRSAFGVPFSAPLMLSVSSMNRFIASFFGIINHQHQRNEDGGSTTNNTNNNNNPDQQKRGSDGNHQLTAASSSSPIASSSSSSPTTMMKKNNNSSTSNFFSDLIDGITNGLSGGDFISTSSSHPSATKDVMYSTSTNLKNSNLARTLQQQGSGNNNNKTSNSNNSNRIVDSSTSNLTKYSTAATHGEILSQTSLGKQFSSVITPILMNKFDIIVDRLNQEFTMQNVSARVAAPRRSFIARQCENLVRIAMLVFSGYHNGSLVSNNNNNSAARKFSSFTTSTTAGASSSSPAAAQRGVLTTAASVLINKSSPSSSSSNHQQQASTTTIEFSRQFSVVDAIAENFQLSSPLSWKYATLIFAAHHRLASAALFQNLLLPDSEIMESIAHLFMTELCSESNLFMDTELQDEAEKVSKLLSDSRLVAEIIKKSADQNSMSMNNLSSSLKHTASTQSLASIVPLTPTIPSAPSPTTTATSKKQENSSNLVTSNNNNLFGPSPSSMNSSQQQSVIATPTTTGNFPITMTSSDHHQNNNSNNNNTLLKKVLAIISKACFYFNHGAPPNNSSNNNAHHHTSSKGLLLGFVCEIEKLFVVFPTTTSAANQNPNQNNNSTRPDDDNINNINNNNNTSSPASRGRNPSFTGNGSFNNNNYEFSSFDNNNNNNNNSSNGHYHLPRFASFETLQEIKQVLKDLVRIIIQNKNDECSSVRNYSIVVNDGSGGVLGGGNEVTLSFANEATRSCAEKILNVCLVLCTMTQAASSMSM